MILLLIALGGAAGAVSRYLVSGWVHHWTGSGTFPWGTLVVNVAGSLALGFGFRFLEGVSASPELRTLMAVGFLGAFTTFSTFSFETLALLQDREWGPAVGYVAGSVVLALAAALVGVGLATALLHARG